MLRSYESVVAADNSHIAVHKAGAVESTGHKINLLPGVIEKVTQEAIADVLAVHTDEHYYLLEADFKSS
ncbi:MAG TPA: hypothetical protein VJK54_10645 [Chthoniobacterales bacterium]|nr:hypothetical protein [Chthoniobacterales bacterium]